MVRTEFALEFVGSVWKVVAMMKFAFAIAVFGSATGFVWAEPVDVPVADIGMTGPSRSVEPLLFDKPIDMDNPPRVRWWKKEGTFPREPVPGITAQPFQEREFLGFLSTQPSLKSSWVGHVWSRSNPPDPDLAVGPRHVVTTVNTRVAFFDKFTGAKGFDQSLGKDGFFTLPANVDYFLSDPRVVFDKGSGRFYLSMMEVQYGTKRSFIHLGVSKTADPYQGWHTYRFETTATVDGQKHWMDFPMLGFGRDGIVLAGNLFPFATNAAGWGSRIATIRKSSVLSGGSAVIHFFNEKASFGIQPMRHNETAADRVYAVNARYLNALQVYCWTNLAGTPSMQKLIEPPAKNAQVLVVNQMDPPAAAPSARGRYLDSIDGRLLGTYFRGGSLYCAQAVAQSSTEKRPQIRWYEISVNGWPTNGSQIPTIRQRGVITAPAGAAFTIPQIAANRDGDAAIVYTRASDSIVADIMASVRRASDPLHSMGTPTVLHTSPGGFFGTSTDPNRPARWGDFFGLAVDPTDELSFWAAAQYSGASDANPENWITRIVRFLVRPTSKTPATLVSISRPFGGAVTGSVEQARTSDNQYFTVQTGGTPTRAQLNFTFRYTGDRTRIEGLDLVLEAHGIAGSNAVFRVFNRTRSQWEEVGATTFSGVDLLRTLRFRSHWPDYFSSTGDFLMQVEARGPSPHIFRVDLARLNVERS
jgi:hypothetical protein